LFIKSFWIAGFECPSHRRRSGQRLALIAPTGHDRLAAADDMRPYPQQCAVWLRRVDEFLAQSSWRQTWQQMSDLVDDAVAARRGPEVPEAERSTSTCSII
jgi:hypothetical protein